MRIKLVRLRVVLVVRSPSTVMLSPETKLAWLRHRPRTVGITSFCYALPFLWGGWPLWLVQAYLSFQSDYVLTGRRSWFHVADRVLASSQVVLFLTLSAITDPPVHEVVAAAAALAAYALSCHGIRIRKERTYVLGHTAWHAIGSAGLVATSARHCELSLLPTCDARRWFAVLPCACGQLYVYAALAIFCGAVLASLGSMTRFRPAVAIVLI